MRIRMRIRMRTRIRMRDIAVADVVAESEYAIN